jgi:hypothetical protein
VSPWRSHQWIGLNSTKAGPYNCELLIQNQLFERGVIGSDKRIFTICFHS